MKCGIITITSGVNYGNRLQNYATQQVLKDYDLEVETIINLGEQNENLMKKTKKTIKYILKRTLFLKKYKYANKREKSFKEFNKDYINFSKFKIANKNIPDDINKDYDCFVCGSDQIWNPNYPENAGVNFLDFVHGKKKIAFAPSFATNKVPDFRRDELSEWIRKIDYLSVREDKGKEIVQELTKRTDVEVLVDPTMLLTSDEWKKLLKKPKQLKNDRYILNYFLGDLSEERKKEIYRIAKENDCDVINILDNNSPFYATGPSEFLYLEKNAFLVCTDSFHSCIFAIIFNRPFIVFEREDKTVSMNSRIDTLLSKFNLKNRKFNGRQITSEYLEHDYTEAYQILEKERKKSELFLIKSLGLNERK